MHPEKSVNPKATCDVAIETTRDIVLSYFVKFLPIIRFGISGPSSTAQNGIYMK